MPGKECGEARGRAKPDSAKILNPKDDAWKDLWKDEGGSLDIETACMQELAAKGRGRGLDIESTCLQEIVGRPRGNHIWNK